MRPEEGIRVSPCSLVWSPPSSLSQTSYEMMMQCVSRMLAHPLHGKDPAAEPSTVQCVVWAGPSQTQQAVVDDDWEG